MNIRSALLEEHSKAQALKIVKYIGRDEERLAELMTLFFEGEYRVNQRAAWVVSHMAGFHPDLFQPYLRQMIENLQNPIHDAVKRNTLRILQDFEIPEDLLGIAADCCFGFLMDTKEPVAIRVFSMSVCYNICVKEPDLANELKLIIEEHYPHGTAGFKSRGRKVLKLLKNLLKQQQ